MKGTLYLHDEHGNIISSDKFEGSKKELKARMQNLEKFRPYFDRDTEEAFRVAAQQELREHRQRMM